MPPKNNKPTETVTTPPPSDNGSKPVQKVYRAPSRNYRLEGFVPEQRSGDGRIIVSSKPLIFNDYLCVTSDPVVIAFIERSDAFRNNHEINEHPSIDDAMRAVNRADADKKLTSGLQSISEDTKSYKSLGQLPAGLNQADTDQ